MCLRFAVAAVCAAFVVVIGRGIAAAETIHLEINPQKSEVKASVAEPLGQLRDQVQTDGTFKIISGDVDGDPNNPGQTGHVKLVIDATSYDSGNDHRDRAVLSSALETAQYQTISFESIRLEKVQIDAPGKMGSATVVGNLTLHGTTREMSVPVNASISPEGTLIADGQMTFRYTDFGVRAPRLLFALPAGKEVTVEFHVIAEPANAQQSK
ncbi:MAG TPA: YceI family protein [Candidatus Binataceae bacterium]|nr:YceI family protein [Candidatus Binataceae bacterium]